MFSCSTHLAIHVQNWCREEHHTEDGLHSANFSKIPYVYREVSMSLHSGNLEKTGWGRTQPTLMCSPVDEVIQGVGGFIRMKHQQQNLQFFFSVVISPSWREHQPSFLPFYVQSVERKWEMGTSLIVCTSYEAPIIFMFIPRRRG